jgi:hypothetical protein
MPLFLENIDRIRVTHYIQLNNLKIEMTLSVDSVTDNDYCSLKDFPGWHAETNLFLFLLGDAAYVTKVFNLITHHLYYSLHHLSSASA